VLGDVMTAAEPDHGHRAIIVGMMPVDLVLATVATRLLVNEPAA
jgi:hypothetical protein